MRLITYFIFFSLLAIFFVYSAIAIMHSNKFCYLSKRTGKMTILYLSLVIILALCAFWFLFTVNWENL